MEDKEKEQAFPEILFLKSSKKKIPNTTQATKEKYKIFLCVFFLMTYNHSALNRLQRENQINTKNLPGDRKTQQTTLKQHSSEN